MAEKTLSLELVGKEHLMKALHQLGPRAVASMKRALNMKHEEIMRAAKDRTPIDTGNLVNSGIVLPSRVEGTQVISEGGFGGPAVDYAVEVHENLEVRHTVGQAKFYESAMMEASRTMEEDLAVELSLDVFERS
jgi:hypothetical protein